MRKDLTKGLKVIFFIFIVSNNKPEINETVLKLKHSSSFLPFLAFIEHITGTGSGTSTAGSICGIRYSADGLLINVRISTIL